MAEHVHNHCVRAHLDVESCLAKIQGWKHREKAESEMGAFHKDLNFYNDHDKVVGCKR
jgi:hypothetical protein